MLASRLFLASRWLNGAKIFLVVMTKRKYRYNVAFLGGSENSSSIYLLDYFIILYDYHRIKLSFFALFKIPFGTKFFTLYFSVVNKPIPKWKIWPSLRLQGLTRAKKRQFYSLISIWKNGIIGCECDMYNRTVDWGVSIHWSAFTVLYYNQKLIIFAQLGNFDQHQTKERSIKKETRPFNKVTWRQNNTKWKKIIDKKGEN